MDEISKEVKKLYSIIEDTLTLNYPEGVDSLVIAIVLSDMLCNIAIDQGMTKDIFLRNINFTYDTYFNEKKKPGILDV